MQKLNFLYPDFLRKIDRSLLLNHPLIWRTRVHEFLWFSLILGNVLAISLALFMATTAYPIGESKVILSYIVLMIIIAFPLLLWGLRVLRFKAMPDNYKDTLTTWLIYAGCIASLGVNVAAFTATLAFGTAIMTPHSLSTLQEDHRTFYDMTNDDKYYRQNSQYNYVMYRTYYSKELAAAVNRYNYEPRFQPYPSMLDFQILRNRTAAMRDAKLFFLAQPIGGLGGMKALHSNYNDLLRMHWKLVLLLLFFVPPFLFLAHQFDIIHALTAVFITGLSTALLAFVIDMMTFPSGFEQALFLVSVWFTTLMLMLSVTKKKGISGKVQPYIASVFLLFIPMAFCVAAISIADYYGGMTPSLLLGMLIVLIPASAAFIHAVIQQKKVPAVV